MVMVQAEEGEGCRNKEPHIWWLKATDIDALTVLETRRPSHGVGRALLPPKVGRTNAALHTQPLVPCWCSLALLGLQTHHANLSLCLYPAFSPVCLCSNVPLLIRAPVLLDSRFHSTPV